MKCTRTPVCTSQHLSVVYGVYFTWFVCLEHGARLLDCLYNYVCVHCMLLSFCQSTNQLLFKVWQALLHNSVVNYLVICVMKRYGKLYGLQIELKLCLRHNRPSTNWTPLNALGYAKTCAVGHLCKTTIFHNRPHLHGTGKIVLICTWSTIFKPILHLVQLLAYNTMALNIF